MIARIQQLPLWLRTLIFSAGIVVVILIFFILALLPILQSVTNPQRTLAVPIAENIAVEEFAVLPDDDAYPAALAIAPDGTLYTGSYRSGVVWIISPDGDIQEKAGSREFIGSVSGLTTDSDGVVYILDRVEPLQAAGAVIWRSVEGELQEIARFSSDPLNGVILPDDIAVDAAGNIYISDFAPDRIWRLDPDGRNPQIWWQPANAEDIAYETIGLAHHPQTDSILVTDPLQSTITRIPTTAADPQAAAEIIYSHPVSEEHPGFDGLTVTPEGDIYVAALGRNRVARLENGELFYLAGGFRGASDVAYDAERERLYVNNWDQSHLQPFRLFIFSIDTNPRLPFALDVVTFNAETTTE